jgi:chaperonin cofactor prefoldin
MLKIENLKKYFEVLKVPVKTIDVSEIKERGELKELYQSIIETELFHD